MSTSLYFLHLIFFACWSESLFTVQWSFFLSTTSVTTMCHIWAAQWGLLLLEHEHTGTKLFTLSVCKIKFNSILLIPLCFLRRHKMTMRLNWRDTVGIHVPCEHNDCVTVVQNLQHCAINNAVGDDERASKVWDWLLWSQAITQCLSLRMLTVGFGVKLQAFTSQYLEYWKTQWAKSSLAINLLLNADCLYSWVGNKTEMEEGENVKGSCAQVCVWERLKHNDKLIFLEKKALGVQKESSMPYSVCKSPASRYQLCCSQSKL